jgi:hypothetical protein
MGTVLSGPQRRIAVTLPAALVALAFVSPSAMAKTITLGSVNASRAVPCQTGYSWVQQATAPSSPSYRAPVAGKIKSWTTTENSAPASAALQIWRPTSNPFQFKAVGQSSTETIPAGHSPITFPTSISVKKGDTLGLVAISGLPSCLYRRSTLKGDLTAYLFGDPTSGIQSFSPYEKSRLNVSVKFGPVCVVPKLKGKTLAAAKNALQASGCALGKVTKRTSSRPAGTVLSQKPGPGKYLPDGSKVSVVVARH